MSAHAAEPADGHPDDTVAAFRAAMAEIQRVALEALALAKAVSDIKIARARIDAYEAGWRACMAEIERLSNLERDRLAAELAHGETDPRITWGP